MSSLKAEDVIRKSQRIVWETLDNEGVLLNLDNGNYFSLNEVGVAIWEELEGDASIQEVTCAIAKKYAIAYQEALPDVFLFIDMLLKRGLVQIKV